MVDFVQGHIEGGKEIREEILYLRQVDGSKALADVFRSIIEFVVAGPLLLQTLDIGGDTVRGFDQRMVVAGFLLHILNE